MELDQQTVLDGWKRRCADLMEQVVLLEAALLQKQAPPEPDSPEEEN